MSVASPTADARHASSHSLFASRQLAYALAIGAVLTLGAIALQHGNSHDGRIMKRVAMGLVDHGSPLVRQTPTFDQFGFNTPYSGYGIGTSLLMAPFYAMSRLLGVGAGPAMNLANVFAVAATCFVMVRLLRRLGYRSRTCVAVAVVLGVCSPLLAYSVSDFSEPGLALLIACALLALEGVSRSSRHAAVGVGAAVGGVVLFRSDSVILIGLPCALALLALSRSRSRDALLAAAGAAPAMVLFVAYNYARFGTFLTGGYGGQRFNHSFLRGVYGLTLSPGRGIFVYAPIVLVSVVVYRFLSRTERVMTALAITLLVARVLFFASWWSWYAGDVWGPRFLLPVLPAFAPCVAAAITLWRRSAFLIVVIAWSAVVAALGLFTATHPERNRYVVPARYDTPSEVVRAAKSAHAPDYPDRVMFDWSRFFP